MKKGHLPKIKKDLKCFLSNEEGRITKKNVKKIALTLVAFGVATAGLMKVDESLARCCSHSVHSVHNHHSRGGWC